MEYDPRYRAGIELFNQRAFFEAHEVWEDLWRETAGTAGRFYKGLIQAAVAVYHAGNGNVHGARRLYRSAQRYMTVDDNPFQGLDWRAFWMDMARAFGDFLIDPAPAPCQLHWEHLPVIALQPPAGSRSARSNPEST